MDLAERYGKGMAPVAGGVLDQTDCFLQAEVFLREEVGFWGDLFPEKD